MELFIPRELVIIIISYISSDKQRAKCRLVCKMWRDIVDIVIDYSVNNNQRLTQIIRKAEKTGRPERYMQCFSFLLMRGEVLRLEQDRRKHWMKHLKYLFLINAQMTTLYHPIAKNCLLPKKKSVVPMRISKNKSQWIPKYTHGFVCSRAQRTLMLNCPIIKSNTLLGRHIGHKIVD